MVIKVRIITPDRILCSTKIEELILPTLTGKVGILNGHAPLITGLEAAGLLRIKLDKKWTPILLFGGVAKIFRKEGTEVKIITNYIEEFTNIELSETTKELEKAILAVKNAKTSKDRIDTALELKKARARSEAANLLEKAKTKD